MRVLALLARVRFRLPPGRSRGYRLLSINAGARLIYGPASCSNCVTQAVISRALDMLSLGSAVRCVSAIFLRVQRSRVDGWQVERNTRWVVVKEVTGLEMVHVRVVQRNAENFQF